MSKKSPKTRSASDPSDNYNDLAESQDRETAGPVLATEPETIEGAAPEAPVEEPAQVQLTIKGSDRSARAAAKRFGGETPKPPPVATPANDVEPPDHDPVVELLSDGKNMVIVTRQTPRSIRDPQTGEKVVTNVRLPGKYTCPTTVDAIAEQVFEEHGGQRYKATIHRDTSNGENTILGHFTFEHPDQNVDPYIEGVTDFEEPQESSRVPTGGDPTLRETDPLIKLKQDLERRLERARVKKEIEELEQQVQTLEGSGRQAPAAPVGESDEVRKLREQLAEKDRQLAEKKVNDQFDQIRGTLSTLTQAVTALTTVKPVEKSGESELMKFIMKKMETDSTQMSTLMNALATKPSAPVRSAGDELDTFLNRAEKLKAITGAGENKGGRLSEIESRLIDVAWERLNGGGEGGGEGGVEDTEDVAKLAVKEFAPILKSFVENKMKQETSGGQTVTSEREKQIHEEAAKFAVSRIAESLHEQGITLQAGPGGKLIAMVQKPGAPKPAATPRHAGTKVVSEHRGAGGVVKKVLIEPTDLSTKKVSQTAPQEETDGKGGDVTHGVFPMLGDGGATLKIKFPIRPGEMKYDRKYAVDFILSGIRSEIRQQLPQKAANNQEIESYVASDAIEFLDEQLLDKLETIDNGPQLEALLTECGGDQTQIAEIKKAGEEESVASYLRRLIMTIQKHWAVEKSKGK
jgi:hypothetical protein